MSSSNTRRGRRHLDAGPSSSRGPSSLRTPKRGKIIASSSRGPPQDLLEGPYRDEAYIEAEHNKSPILLKPLHKETPKSSLNNFYSTVKQKLPQYKSIQGKILQGDHYVQVWRTTVELEIEPAIIATGDHADKRQSVYLAALSAIYQLQELGVLDDHKKLLPEGIATALQDVTLSDGSVVPYEQACSFMDYYCRKFSFGQPEIDFICSRSSLWEAVMSVGGRKIGLGSGVNKKAAQTNCYLDVTKYLEGCDPELWKAYLEAAKTGKDLGMGPKDIRRTNLYRHSRDSPFSAATRLPGPGGTHSGYTTPNDLQSRPGTPNRFRGRF